MQVSVKNVEEKVFRDFKAESVRDGIKMGKALSLAMKLWLEKKEKKPKMKILNLKPIHWGKKTTKTSEEIDEVVY